MSTKPDGKKAAAPDDDYTPSFSYQPTGFVPGVYEVSIAPPPENPVDGPVVVPANQKES